jgi:peptidoglycan/LPS O-acetylase OafA/YrhL
MVIRAAQNKFTFLSKKILEHPFVVYVGKISYGMYVYHLFMQPLFYYISPHIGIMVTDKYSMFAFTYLLTFLLAHISWKLIENPINNLKGKFPYFTAPGEPTVKNS